MYVANMNSGIAHFLDVGTTGRCGLTVTEGNAILVEEIESPFLLCRRCHTFYVLGTSLNSGFSEEEEYYLEEDHWSNSEYGEGIRPSYEPTLSGFGPVTHVPGV